MSTGPGGLLVEDLDDGVGAEVHRRSPRLLHGRCLVALLAARLAEDGVLVRECVRRCGPDVAGVPPGPKRDWDALQARVAPPMTMARSLKWWKPRPVV